MDSTVKNLSGAEIDPRLWRAKEKARAAAGELPQTACPHPISAIEQFVDEEPGARYYRPTNLFMCTICKQMLRLVDFNGKDAIDG